MNRSPFGPSTRALAAVAAVWFATALSAPAQDLKLPMKDGSVRFAVMGDTGTASTAQSDVGKQMAAFHAVFPFEFVIMVGDNLYGGSYTPADYKSKFQSPYAALIDAKVKFYAALGNHDNSSEDQFKDWNMGGQRYYTFRASPGGLGKIASPGVRFFALDTTYMDKTQLEWLESELTKSSSEWKIAFFHHPLYSSGRTHGSSLDLRASLEPLFIKHDVNAVFSGHDHFYERIKPQHGIYYFVSGAGGSLRKGDINRNTGLTDVGFDTDFHFMLVEIAGSDLYFQAISRTGKTVDSGVIHHAAFDQAPAPVTPLPDKGTPVPTVPGIPDKPTPTPAPTPSPR
jgi:hypothetical protein